MQADSFENRSLFHRVGIYLLLFVAVGVGGGVLIYVFNMQLAGWVMGGPNVGFSKSATSGAHVVLYESASTRRFFTSVGGNYDVLLEPWRAFARTKGIQLKEIKSLDGVSPTARDVLVLPSAVALDASERSALLRYQKEGGSLLLTWASGTRDGGGQWMGWDFLKQVAGVTMATELASDASRNHLVSLGEGPLTHGLEAGTRIWLGRLSETPVVFRGGEVAALASTSQRGNDPSGGKEGVLVFQERGFGNQSSRVVLMGAAETSWEYQPDDIYELMSGALGWLVRQPAIVRSNWPNGLSSAYLIGIDVDDGYADGLRMARVLSSVGLKGSYYVLTSSARADPVAVRSLHSSFDVGYRGDTPTPFKGQPAAVQARRVKGMVDEMTAVLGPTALSGFNAVSGAYDDATTQALYGAGIRYHLTGGQETKSNLPFFRPVKGEAAGERFVALPKTVRDERALLGDASGDQTRLSQALIQDFQGIKTQGGLGVLNVQTQTPGTLLDQALPPFATHLKNNANAVWISDGAGIANWWSERERFQIGLRASGVRLEVDVSVVGSEPFDNGALIVTLARKGQLPTLRGLKPGMAEPMVGLLDDYRALIRFGKLSPGNYSYQLTQ